MKHSILKSVIIILAAGLAFTSCEKGGGGGNAAAGIVGTWDFKRVTGSTQFSDQSLTQAYNSSIYGELQAGQTWIFESGSNCTLQGTACTYTFNNNTLVVSMQGGSMTFQANFSGNNLTLTMDQQTAMMYCQSVLYNSGINPSQVQIYSTTCAFEFTRQGGGSTTGGW